MLHILWMIIKFILIVPGILLGVVLLAILLLLFDPIRYRAMAQKEAEGLETVKADARVSWLFGLISLRASFVDGKSGISIRIFGIPFEKLKGFLDKKKTSAASSEPADKTKKGRREKRAADVSEDSSAKRKRTAAGDAHSVPGSALQKGSSANGNLPETADSGEDRHAEKYTDSGEDRHAEENADPCGDASSGHGLFSRILGILKTIFGLPVRAVKFLIALPGKIAAVIQKIRVTIQNICDKISWWRDFLEEEHTRAVLLLVKQQAGGLIRHILPTKVSGEVTFGCEDPSLTGRILAVLGMSFPLHKNRIAVTPLFDGENHLTGRVILKGRIYGIVVLAAAFKIIINKNTKYVISRWKSKA